MAIEDLKNVGVSVSRPVNQAAPYRKERNLVQDGSDGSANIDPVGDKLHPFDPQDAVYQVAGKVSDYAQSLQRDLIFSVDEDSGKTVIKVMDSETQELVRQIPPEEILRIAERLEEMAEGGLLFRDQA